MAHVFRTDNTNIGDWYCPPFRYFPFKPSQVFDILDEQQKYLSEDIIILGGGSLGREFFEKYLNNLKTQDRKYTLIAWGVGVDEVIKHKQVLSSKENFELFGTWFDGFDEVGIRCYSEKQKYLWVPCASCMNPLFFKYREKRPKKKLGIYNHKRVPLLNKSIADIPSIDNSGNNLEEKLSFISQHEYILTNTYHGVYWATLMNRKVICIPFKSGLFSFKHPPTYSDGKINEAILEKATSFPNSLEECREKNINFYLHIFEKYGDL